MEILTVPPSGFVKPDDFHCAVTVVFAVIFILAPTAYVVLPTSHPLNSFPLGAVNVHAGNVYELFSVVYLFDIEPVPPPEANVILAFIVKLIDVSPVNV